MARLSTRASSSASKFLAAETPRRSLPEPLLFGTICGVQAVSSPIRFEQTSAAKREIHKPMAVQQIDKIKQEFTDKYVVVDATRPELARFDNLVGQVKTVNMSGRALVEFLDYHLNIGWYDIDLDYLKVVDKPSPKEVKKPAAKKPAAKPPAKKQAGEAGEKKLSPLEMARMQGAGGKAAPKEKASTADILAAARGGAAPAAKKSESKAEAPAAPAKTDSEKVDRSKMSVADMLAAARGEKSAPAAAAPAEPAAPVEEAPPAAAEPVEEAPPAADSGGVVKVDRSSMSMDDMIAYCREKDAG